MGKFGNPAFTDLFEDEPKSIAIVPELPKL